MLSVSLFIVCVIGLASICYGQICDIGSIYQCMKPSDPDPLITQNPQEQCFVSAGCTVPRWSPEPFDSCIQQIHSAIHSSVQACVLQKLPSLTISLFNDGQPVVNRREDQLYKMVNASCQNAGAALKVEECLRNSSQPVKMEPKRFGVNMTDWCEKKKKCMDSLPANCTTQMKNLKNQICSCARSEILGNSLSIQSELKACIQTTSAPKVTITSLSSSKLMKSLIEKAKSSLTGYVKSVEDALSNEAKGKMQHDLEDVVKSMCVEKKWDICSMINPKNGV